MTFDKTTKPIVYLTVKPREFKKFDFPEKIAAKFSRPINTGSFAMPFHWVRD